MIRYHGAGFLQFKINETDRVHVWHPDLPTKMTNGLIHDHNFDYESEVLLGRLTHHTYIFEPAFKGPHALWPVLPKEEKSEYSRVGVAGVIKRTAKYEFGTGFKYQFEKRKLHHLEADGYAITRIHKFNVDEDYWPQTVSYNVLEAPGDAYPEVPFYTEDELKTVVAKVWDDLPSEITKKPVD